VKQALDEGRPYRNGLRRHAHARRAGDGLETIESGLWAHRPGCAKSSYVSAHFRLRLGPTWWARLNHSDKLLVVKKPFEAIEVHAMRQTR